MLEGEARESCRDRLEAALARIETVGDSAIFTRLYIDSARSFADAADDRRRAGATIGPIDGSIITIKDLFDVAGEPTTAGSVILRNAPIARSDAIVVDRLRNAGAVILGKTNMTEFAYSGLGLNPHYGTPRNAAAPDRIPGGSSSGAGVSVAHGIADIAIGTDTGGSVRIPASLNGVVGFKPTAERIPLKGAFPLSYSLDSIGPLARTVQACADADAVMAGQSPMPLTPASLAGLRFGVPEIYLEDTDGAVLGAFRKVLRDLELAGAVVRPAPLDGLIGQMREILSEAPIIPAEAAEVHAERLAKRPTEFDPRVLARIRRGAEITAPEYLSSIRHRTCLIAAMDRQMGELDCLIVPTTPRTAPLIAEVADDKNYDALNALMLRNPGFANFFDLCAISVPMPVGPLSAGVMLTSGHGRDQALLSIARGVESRLLSSLH